MKERLFESSATADSLRARILVGCSTCQRAAGGAPSGDINNWLFHHARYQQIAMAEDSTREVVLVKPDTSGRFEMSLPDFGADPTSAKPGGADFEIVVREAATSNPIAYLQPEEQKLRATAGLKTASSYPQPVIFVARRQN